MTAMSVGFAGPTKVRCWWGGPKEDGAGPNKRGTEPEVHNERSEAVSSLQNGNLQVSGLQQDDMYQLREPVLFQMWSLCCWLCTF